MQGEELINRLQDILADAELELRILQNNTSWIEVSTCLPENDINVLIYVINSEYLSFKIGSHNDLTHQWSTEDGCYYHDISYKMVTHWMHLPKSPKEIK